MPNTRTRNRPGPNRVATAWWSLVLLCVVGSGSLRPAIAQTHLEPQRLDTLRHFATLYQAQQWDSVLPLLEDYLEQHPCDAVMHYNLACVRSLTGQLEAAVASLDRAFALGYADFDGTADDTDLGPLVRSGAVDSLVALHTERRLLQRRARSLELVEGVWSDPVSLTSDVPACRPESTLEVRMRVRSDPEALRIEFDPGQVETSGLRADVVIGVPRGPETLSTRRARVFSGALTEELLLQRWNGREIRRVESTTTVQVREGRIVHEIPWSDLPGLGPPLDPVVAFNVRVWRDEDPAATVGLVSDPFIGSAIVLDRRHADLTILPDGSPAPWLRGRLATNLVVGDSVSVDLVVQGMPEGEAAIEWWIEREEARGGSVQRIEPPRTERVLEPDIAFLHATLGLGGSGSGRGVLHARLDPAGASPLNWRVPFVYMDPDWFAEGRARLARIEHEVERSIVEYRLVQVLAHSRRSDADVPVDEVAPLLAETEHLLELAERTGSPVPPVSEVPTVFEAGYALAENTLAPAMVHRTSPRGGDGLTVCFVEHGRRDLFVGVDHGLLLRSSTMPDDGSETLVVAPMGVRLGQPGAAEQQMSAAVRWVGRFANREPDRITASGGVVEPVLRAYLTLVRTTASLHVLIDDVLDPWPEARAQDLTRVLRRGSGAWTIVIGHTGTIAERTREVVGALRGAGADVSFVELTTTAERDRFLAGVPRPTQRASQ